MVPQRTEWSVWGRGAVKEKEQLPLAGKGKVELQGPPNSPSLPPTPQKHRDWELLHWLLFRSQGLLPSLGPCLLPLWNPTPVRLALHLPLTTPLLSYTGK